MYIKKRKIVNPLQICPIEKRERNYIWKNMLNEKSTMLYIKYICIIKNGIKAISPNNRRNTESKKKTFLKIKIGKRRLVLSLND